MQGPPCWATHISLTPVHAATAPVCPERLVSLHRARAGDAAGFPRRLHRAGAPDLQGALHRPARREEGLQQERLPPPLRPALGAGGPAGPGADPAPRAAGKTRRGPARTGRAGGLLLPPRRPLAERGGHPPAGGLRERRLARGRDQSLVAADRPVGPEVLARRGVAPAVPQRRGGPRAALGLAPRGGAPAVPQRPGGPRA